MGLIPRTSSRRPHGLPAVGARLLANGEPAAVEVPSAALPGDRNLVVLGGRVASRFGVVSVGEVDVPTTVSADDGWPHGAVTTWRPRRRWRGELAALVSYDGRMQSAASDAGLPVAAPD